MNSILQPANYFVFIGFAVISTIIWCLLIRWATRADTIVKNQEATIYFLMKLCEKHGVTEQELHELKEHFKIK